MQQPAFRQQAPAMGGQRVIGGNVNRSPFGGGSAGFTQTRRQFGSPSAGGNANRSAFGGGSSGVSPVRRFGEAPAGGGNHFQTRADESRGAFGRPNDGALAGDHRFGTEPAHGGPGRLGEPDRLARGHGSYMVAGRAHPTYAVGRYNYPHGFRYVRYDRGGRFPRTILVDRTYYVDNYVDYGVDAPPPNFEWIRYGPDLLLVNLDTGEIANTVYGVFDEGTPVLPPGCPPADQDASN